ncbi:MAG: hypothetical protein SO128_01250 [Clostridium cadaveris]|uniref:hypothetical protein n=1 Tax=Clostridium cadaveris TaxID=1529 RepID=UPI002A85A207|nr:hypothetical protein [Clostridium cadaveris]
MDIRTANERELLNLWEETEESMKSTTRFFMTRLKDEKQIPNTCEKFCLLQKQL